MTLWTVIARAPARNALRTSLTVAGIAVAVVAFVLLRTVLDAWQVGAQYAAHDRLSTRNKVSFGLPLPKRYLDDLRANVRGIHSVTHCDWFGGRWAQAPQEFFANMACADDAFEVFPEIVLDAATLERWRRNKQGAIVGDMLAKKLGWHVGDHLTLQGSFDPGDWPLTIDGIYTVTPQAAVDRSTFFFHWDYKNERVAEHHKDRIGWIFTRVDDPARGPAISRAIDQLFDDRDVRTSTMSERAASSELLGGVSAILTALDWVSLIVLAIMTLLLGNALAMSVRERTTEYAVLRALGFAPGVVRALIVGEALLIGLAGAGVGLVLAYPLVQLGLGRFLEENMGKYFPVFRIGATTQLGALSVTLLLSLAAALLPARRIARMSIVDALRRVA